MEEIPRCASPTRVAFFTPEFRVSGNEIFLSQVIGQAGALHEAGFECMLIGSEVNEESVQEALMMPQLRLFSRACVLPIYPTRPNSVQFYKIARIAAEMAGGAVYHWKPDVIYVRGAAAFRSGLHLAGRSGARMAYDAHGLGAEESVLKRGRWNLLARYHRHREMEAFRKADTLVCVSTRFRTHLERLTGRRDILVVPCCVNDREFGYRPDARSRIRRQLGWSTETPVAAYCGGLSVWQRVGEVLRLMVEMKSVEPALKCLLLTRDANMLAQLAVNAGLSAEDFHAAGVPHQEIPEWLSAADAGIILRDNVLVNNVASPVKIAEYLACGLPVICSPGIGDLSDMVEKAQTGIVLNDGEPHRASRAVELIRRVHQQPRFRREAQQLARDKLTWSTQLRTLQLGYSRPELTPFARARSGPERQQFSLENPERGYPVE